MQDHDEIIVFQQFNSAIDASIIKTKLDAYGIPCFLTEENMSNLYPGQPFLAFNVRLHLFAGGEELARQVLADGNFTIDNESTVKCPRCKSLRIERDFPKKLADSLSFLIFGVFFPHKKVYCCLNCDYEFDTMD